MDEEHAELQAAGHDPTLGLHAHRDAIEYSWAWVTADRCLTSGPADLVFAVVIPSAATTDSAIYDGVDANGEHIVTMAAAVAAVWQFAPRRPVYCRSGIFVHFGTAVTGLFVQWRERGRRGPGGAWA